METSYVNKITGFVIALVLGAILVGGMLAPTVAGIQDTVGNPITKTNESQQYMSLSMGDVEMDLTNGALTVNGEEYTFVNTDRIIFACDSFVIYYNGTNAYGSYVEMQAGIRNISTFDISVVNGVINASVTYDNNVTQSVSDKPIVFSFYIDPNGDYSYFAPQYAQPYVKTIKDLYAFGAYYTGDNDTYYWYYNGIAGGYSEDYTYAFDATLSKAEGTTDIYTASDISFSVGDESFTPFSMIVAKAVDGHATAGPAYAMFGVIVLLAIVMLVVISANAVKGKYN